LKNPTSNVDVDVKETESKTSLLMSCKKFGERAVVLCTLLLVSVVILTLSRDPKKLKEHTRLGLLPILKHHTNRLGIFLKPLLTTLKSRVLALGRRARVELSIWIRRRKSYRRAQDVTYGRTRPTALTGRKR